MIKKGQRKPEIRKEKAPFTPVFVVLWERKEAVITTGFGGPGSTQPHCSYGPAAAGYNISDLKMLKLGMSWRNKLSLPAVWALEPWVYLA